MLDPVHGDIPTVLLGIGVLLLTGPVFAVLARVAKVNEASSSLGIRLLLVGVPLVLVGVAVTIMQNSFEKGNLLYVLDWVCLIVSLFGYVLMFVGLGISLFESIKVGFKR